MMFLLDTNVVSETGKKKPHGAVLAWIAAVPVEELFISAMTIAEIQVGAERTREHDLAKATEIEAWLNWLIETSQVVPMDADVAKIWAKLMQGRSRALAEDAWIAATAKTKRLTIATRNLRAFAGFDVETFNPFEDVRAQNP